jgi:hypothetical protein
MVQIWCSYNKCGSGQVEVMDKDGSSQLSPSQSWMMWVERSVIEPGRAVFIVPCNRVCNIGHEHVGCLWVCNSWMPEQLPDQLMPHRISTSDSHMLDTLTGGRKDSKPRLVFSILWHSKSWGSEVDLRPERLLFAAGTWEISVYAMAGAWTMWRSMELMSIYYRKLCLSSLTSVYLKK